MLSGDSDRVAGRKRRLGFAAAPQSTAGSCDRCGCRLISEPDVFVTFNVT